MCPTPNCGGAGFTFDIFPTDPTHPANEGWHSSDDDDEDADGEWDDFVETLDQMGLADYLQVYQEVYEAKYAT